MLHSWLLAGHIYGFMMWVGTLFGLFQILAAHGGDESANDAAWPPLQKSVAVASDIGATIAIVFGLLLLFLPEGGTAILKGGGFFHTKLLLVAALVACHVYLRRKVRLYRSGGKVPPPAWLFPAMSIGVLVIVVLMTVRPF